MLELLFVIGFFVMLLVTGVSLLGIDSVYAPQARRVMNLCPCEGGFPDTRPGLLRERFALARREQFVDERLVAHEGDIHGVLLV